MMLHVWTFKDDSLPFGASTPIVQFNLFRKLTILAKTSLNLTESSLSSATPIRTFLITWLKDQNDRFYSFDV